MYIEFAENWLTSMGSWGDDNITAPYYLSTHNSSYLITNAQKIHHNLAAFGRKDRAEWQTNIYIIEESLGHYSYQHISCMKVHKMTMPGNYYILHLGIHLIDGTQFQCGYVLSNTLNLCGNFYSKQFEDDTVTEEESDYSSHANTSLDLSSISFELPRNHGQLDANIDEISGNIESEGVDILSIHSEEENETPSDSIVNPENELANIFSSGKNGNLERIPKPRRTSNWQPDIFRALTRSPAFTDLKTAANTPADSNQLLPPSF